MYQGGFGHRFERDGALPLAGTRGPVDGCDGDGVHVIIVVTPLNVNVQLEQVDSSLEAAAAAALAEAVGVRVTRVSSKLEAVEAMAGPEFEHACLMTTVMMMVKSRTLELSDDDGLNDGRTMDDDAAAAEAKQQLPRQKNKGGAALPPPPTSWGKRVCTHGRGPNPT